MLFAIDSGSFSSRTKMNIVLTHSLYEKSGDFLYTYLFIFFAFIVKDLRLCFICQKKLFRA